MARKAKASTCEHLNVKTQEFSGVQVAVCQDCHKQVDPASFEPVVAKMEARPVDLPADGPSNRPTSGLKRVYDAVVEQTVNVPGLDKPFFPLFDVKAGDVIVVLRK